MTDYKNKHEIEGVKALRETGAHLTHPLRLQVMLDQSRRRLALLAVQRAAAEFRRGTCVSTADGASVTIRLPWWHWLGLGVPQAVERRRARRSARWWQRRVGWSAGDVKVRCY